MGTKYTPRILLVGKMQMDLLLTKDKEGNFIKILDIKVFKVEKDKPRVLFYKNSYTEKELKNSSCKAEEKN